MEPKETPVDPQPPPPPPPKNSERKRRWTKPVIVVFGADDYGYGTDPAAAEDASNPFNAYVPS